MSDLEGFGPEGISVGDFVLARDLGLNLEILHAGEGMAHPIRSPRIQKLGMALAGYTDYIHPDRILLLGGSEGNYLKILNPAAYHTALHNLHSISICCVLITKGLEVPPGLVDTARACSFPLLRTSVLSSIAIHKIGEFLEARLAARLTLHGVFVEVFGLGVLILGPSGIGKSECALELLLRGHRLISDDSVEFTRCSHNGIHGTGGPVLRHHMELRGLGIIDIRELFGISATGEGHALDFVVRLERWQPENEYDRLGLDQDTIPIMQVPVPLITMPVAPGRNVSILIEVAARTQLLRKRGLRLSRELQDNPPIASESQSTGIPGESD
jgi:HPr kinase/phosphorylase